MSLFLTSESAFFAVFACHSTSNVQIGTYSVRIMSKASSVSSPVRIESRRSGSFLAVWMMSLICWSSVNWCWTHLLICPNRLSKFIEQFLYWYFILEPTFLQWNSHFEFYAPIQCDFDSFASSFKSSRSL